MNELETTEYIPPPGVTDAAERFLDRALAMGNIEVIERAMALYERREDRAALVEYNKALAAAKAEIPAIIKDRVAAYDHKDGRGRTSYSYAELATICKAVDPALSKHGLYYRWRTENEPNKQILVTCIVYHTHGHSEENSLGGVADSSGFKNPIQQVQSTITYLQRGTLCAALGIAAGRDDDAQASTGKEDPLIGEAEVERIKQRIDKLGIRMADFFATLKVEKIEDLRVSQLKQIDREFEEFETWQRKLAAKKAAKEAAEKAPST
jgi:hypothetical protein